MTVREGVLYSAEICCLICALLMACGHYDFDEIEMSRIVLFVDPELPMVSYAYKYVAIAR
jgi:hypothetical protein